MNCPLVMLFMTLRITRLRGEINDYVFICNELLKQQHFPINTVCDKGLVQKDVTIFKSSMNFM